MHEATEAAERPEWQIDPSFLRHDEALIKRYSSGTVIAYLWSEKGVMRIIVFLFLFICLPCSLFIFGSDWQTRGFGVLCIVFTYLGFSSVLNSAWIRLTDSELIIHYAPLPSLGAGTFHRSAISGVRIGALDGEGPASYCVYIDRHHRRSIALSPAFGLQMAQEIKDTIDDWLKSDQAAEPLGDASES